MSKKSVLKHIPSALVDIGLSAWGMWYCSDKHVLICANMACKHAVRHESALSHMKSHKAFPKIGNALMKSKVSEALRGREFIGENEGVDLPQGRIAPFPFLETKSGWHCRVCSFACTSKDVLMKHINKEHDEKRSLPRQLCYQEGLVQRFFNHCFGSSYFQVDNVLSDVGDGSDFDLFYTSVQEEKLQELSAEARAGGVACGNWDESPFLARTCWSRQVRGYSLHSMRRKVSPYGKGDSSHLRGVATLAVAYIRSLDQGDIHPAYLSRLNNWKM